MFVRGHGTADRRQLPPRGNGIAAVADADIINVTVLDDAQVHDVILGEDGLARNANRHGDAIHSTIATARPSNWPHSSGDGIHVVDAW